jgi:hypothetical protein
MKKEDYAKLIEKVDTDRSKSDLEAFAEGAALLAKLGGKNIASDHEVIYCEGPEIEELSEEDARKLAELGFRDYDNDMGFQYFT